MLKDAAFHLDQSTKRGKKIRCTNVYFSGPNDEDEHQNPSSDDNQVIQQESVCSEPPEPLSYPLFQSHFQGSSTSNTQKIFLPKPIWEKLSKDQQQMIIDHNRSLPKSGSPHLSTPNKSPSPLPHKPTPQQTAKSQQVHTHQSDESTTDTTTTETTPSDPLLAMVHQSIHTSDDDASDISNVLSVKSSQPISIRVHPKSLTGMLYAHFLHGHPHPASRTLSMSPPGMVLLHTQDYIKKHFMSRNPVFNIPRRSEAVATDTIFSDTPAVDDGSTMAQFFCGHNTLVCDAYGIKSTKQFINTLSDNIRKRGAMDTLISDGGKYEISKRVTDLLRSLFIQDYQSEPYHQHQNKAENRFGLAKRYTNTVMVALLAVGYSVCSSSELYSTTWHLQLFKAYALFKPWKELLQMLVSCFISNFMSLSTTGLILLSLISTSLHHLMKRRVIGLAWLTTKVTLSPGGSSLRILKRSSFVLAFEVPSELPQTSILHHLQGRGPRFLFPFLILNNLQILCHLTPLMHQHPILSNLSKVSLVKMKIIQSTWPTLTFPIFMADPSFYHLRIMGSATWTKSLTLMTMDNLLKTLHPEGNRC